VTDASQPDHSAVTALAYDATATEFSALTSRRSVEATAFLDRFIPLVPIDGVVADLGCGPGHELAVFAERGLNAVGIDLSMELLRIASVRGPVVAAELGRLPVREASLAAIWCGAALLHIDRGRLGSVVREWRRALSPNGVVGLATSLGGDEGWELSPTAAARDLAMPGAHRRWFVHHHRDEVIAAIEATGLTIVEALTRHADRDWLYLLAVATSYTGD
jgi:SAM-dependent methyltransferase